MTVQGFIEVTLLKKMEGYKGLREISVLILADTISKIYHELDGTAGIVVGLCGRRECTLESYEEVCDKMARALASE